ncbi:PIN domain-containing protein [Candidatus Electrothrix sp.]|uniref:PIN domain-containing protein n=1 Tax=Candidatus Electrothrix sp. TaxID=2170559 RepID=UPI004056EFC0
MSEKAFFDTNILFYLYSVDEPDKQAVSRRAVRGYSCPTVSTQILNELANTLHRKMQVEWNTVDAVLQEIDHAFHVETVTVPVIRKACAIAERYRYSYYDSAVLASALLCGATLLISEDMHHGQFIEDQLQIVNPFITT